MAVAEGRTRAAEPEELAVVRCSSCLGLRTVSYRNRDTAARCPDCRRGDVVPLSAFHDFWLQRFSLAEICTMGKHIWGLPSERADTL